MRIILTVFLTFALMACGFKGSLYLPDPSSTKKVRTSPPPATPYSTQTASTPRGVVAPVTQEPVR